MANPKLIQSSDYREFLKAVFSERKNRNQSYSLRAYAKSLDISHSHLFGILKGSHKLTIFRAKQFLVRLNLEPLEAQVFLELTEKQDQPAQSTPTQSRLSEPALSTEHQLVFSDWYNIVILELASLSSIKLTESVAARAIGLSEEVCEKAVAHLIDLGFMEKTADGFLRRTIPGSLNFATNSDSIARYNEQILGVVKDSIRNLTSSERTIGCKVFSMNRRQFAFLQERIYSLLHDIMAQAKDLSDPSDHDSVYLVSAQIVPLALLSNKKSPQEIANPTET